MLDHQSDLVSRGDRRSAGQDRDISWSLQEARIILRKYGWMIAVSAAFFTLAGLLYVATATRHYTATTRLLIDTPRNPLVALEGMAGGGGAALNIPEVESQLQVIQSDRIGYKVLKELDKNPNKVALAPAVEPSLIEKLVGAVRSVPSRIAAMLSPKQPPADPEQAALDYLMGSLAVRRLGASYVVEISYTSVNPQTAADVANAFAETYVQDEVDSKAQTWKRASIWLQDRVNELRARSEEASRAAQDFKAANGNNAETWPKARELDRTAEAYDSLYSAFLKKYTDSVQQQTFPITQARIISEASRPTTPSKPQSLLVLGLAAFMGLGLGTAVAFLRWSLDRTIRSPSQIARYGIRCLTTLPRLPRLISRDPAQVVRTVLRAPRSQFTENLRLVRAEMSIVERQRPMRYIGITSASPGEGKTTVASNLAQLFASSGDTLLIDADLRNPQLTRSLSPTLTPRRAETVETPWAQTATSVPGCPGLSFLGIETTHLVTPVNWFEEGMFEEVLERNKVNYSRIFVDLPPAGVVAEARYVAPLLDAIIVVVEWETTAAEAMIQCIDACNVEPGKVFGVVLNKAHPNVLTKMQGTPYASNYFEPYHTENVGDLRNSRMRG